MKEFSHLCNNAPPITIAGCWAMAIEGMVGNNVLHCAKAHRFVFGRTSWEKFYDCRLSIDQSKFQKGDWRERKRETERNVCMNRVCRTVSCRYFFGRRLWSTPDQAIRFQLTIFFFIRSRTCELGKCVTRERRHVLIIHARGCVASLTRMDNFFYSFMIVRSLHAGGVAKRLPGVMENFNLCRVFC